MSAALLHMYMGTGKSKVLLDILQNVPEIRTVLLVVPKRVVTVWPKELVKHLVDPNEWRVVVLANGPIDKRAKELQKQAAEVQGTALRFLVITNYDAVWRGKLGEWLMGQRWDLVAADEVQRIKSSGGKTSRWFAKLRSQARRRIGMSGSPTPHSFLDAFGVFRFLDAAIFGYSFIMFRRKYANFHPSADLQRAAHGAALMINPATGNLFASREVEEEFKRRYASITYYAGPEVLDLPSETDQEVYCELEGPTAKMYKALDGDLVARHRKGLVTAANRMVLVTRLQQVASGYAVIEPDWFDLDSAARLGVRPCEEVVSRAKEKLLAEVLEEIGSNRLSCFSEPIIIFARFVHDLARAKQVWKETFPDEPEALELSGKRDEHEYWQTGESRCLVAQMRAGSLGIDLTRARYAIYYSLDFSREAFQQSRARIHRPGQKRTVAHVYLLTRNTVDEVLLRGLRRGQDLQDAFDDWLREKQDK